MKVSIYTMLPAKEPYRANRGSVPEPHFWSGSTVKLSVATNQPCLHKAIECSRASQRGHRWHLDAAGDGRSSCLHRNRLLKVPWHSLHLLLFRLPYSSGCCESVFSASPQCRSSPLSSPFLSACQHSPPSQSVPLTSPIVDGIQSVQVTGRSLRHGILRRILEVEKLIIHRSEQRPGTPKGAASRATALAAPWRPVWASALA
jgi:hypothetical protein